MQWRYLGHSKKGPFFKTFFLMKNTAWRSIWQSGEYPHFDTVWPALWKILATPVIHTRLRLDACALNYFLFKIGRKESPACFSGFYSESVRHFFLKCPLFAASRHKLLSSAAQMFADRWAYMPICLQQLYQLFYVDAHLFLMIKIRLYFCLSRRLS